MKNFNKTQKQYVAKIEAPMVGDGGWTLGFNKNSQRYDLRCGDVCHYSHVAHYVCKNIASMRFNVKWATNG